MTKFVLTETRIRWVEGKNKDDPLYHLWIENMIVDWNEQWIIHISTIDNRRSMISTRRQWGINLPSNWVFISKA